MLNILTISKQQTLTKECIDSLLENSRMVIEEMLMSSLQLIVSLLYKVSQQISGNAKLVLLREVFFVVNFSHLVDPLSNEHLLLKIGSMFLEEMQQLNPTRTTEMLQEFVLRRLSTCNLGVFDRSMSYSFCAKLLSNIQNGFRLKIESENGTDLTRMFVEDLQTTLDYPHNNEYFSTDIERFQEGVSVAYIYKAINKIYADMQVSLSFCNKAHKLAWINYQTEHLNTPMDLSERIMSLFNSIHNFHGLLQLNQEFRYSFDDCWDIDIRKSNIFNVKAYAFVIERLYHIFRSDKYKLNFPYPRQVQSEAFSYMLLSFSIKTLWKIANRIRKGIINQHTVPAVNIIDLDFMPETREMEDNNLTLLMHVIKKFLALVEQNHPNYKKKWESLENKIDIELQKNTSECLDVFFEDEEDRISETE